MGKVIRVVNPEGRPFNVKQISKGDRYGLNDCLVHEKEDSLIEFYDATADPDKFDKEGQFISRYYLSTLKESISYPRGLTLDGGVPQWYLGSENMDEVLQAFN